MQKFHGAREYGVLWNLRRKSEKVRMAEQFAAESERREGRHTMRLKIQLKPFLGLHPPASLCTLPCLSLHPSLPLSAPSALLLSHTLRCTQTPLLLWKLLNLL